MPKVKISNQEILSRFDRPPIKEGFYEKIKNSFFTIASFYGYEKIFTPVLEDGRFFQPLIKEGLLLDTPPIFCKTRSGEEIVLKSSGAISVLRAYFTHKMHDLPHPLKFFFDTDIFFSSPAVFKNSSGLNSMHNRPEQGLVMIGEDGPVAEAQIVQLIWQGLQEGGIGVEGFAFRVNAIGCPECKSSFRPPFMSYLRNRAVRLCRSCKKQVRRRPVKVLLCEEEKCKIVLSSAPQMLDFLCSNCKKHLTGFLEFLDEMKIPYFLDPKFFQDGLPFNTLVFQLTTESAVLKGEEIAIVADGDPAAPAVKRNNFVLAEGGRLTRAGELMGGRKVEAVGGTIFPEALGRLVGDSSMNTGRQPKVFFAHLGEFAKKKSMAIIEELRAAGIETQESLGRDSIKSQLKVAEKIGAEVALLLGQKEALDGTIIVRETGLGVQETIPQEKLVEFLQKKLKKESKV